MQRDELESIAQSLLEAFNADEGDRYAALLDPAVEVNETRTERLSTNRKKSLARLRVIKDDSPQVVGEASEWVVDETKGTAAAEVVWRVPDNDQLPEVIGSVFLAISDDGLITSIREHHVIRGKAYAFGCPFRIPRPPHPDMPQDGPDI